MLILRLCIQNNTQLIVLVNKFLILNVHLPAGKDGLQRFLGYCFYPMVTSHKLVYIRHLNDAQVIIRMSYLRLCIYCVFHWNPGKFYRTCVLLMWQGIYDQYNILWYLIHTLQATLAICHLFHIVVVKHDWWISSVHDLLISKLQLLCASFWRT